MLAGKCPGRPPGRLASLQNAHWLYIVVSPVYNLNRGRRLSGNTGRGKTCEELSCLKIEIATYASRRGVVLQWLGDGEWTGHNQVEGPPTLSGPVDSYASPEHRQQQAQARRAAAARVAAQREDSSDLASEPVWKSNVAARLDTLVDLHTGRNILRASRPATARAPGPRAPRRAPARAPGTTSRASRPATTRRFLRPCLTRSTTT